MNTVTTFKKQYNEATNNIHNLDKSKAFNIKSNILINEQCFHKKQNISTSIINTITKKNIINNNGDVFNVKDYSCKTYVSNNYNSQTAYVENNLYKRSDNIAFNNTNNI